MKYCNYLADNAKELLTDEVKNNGRATVYYNIDHVSASGMTRYITLRLIKNGELILICRERKIQGCGMDMVFALIEQITESCNITNKVYYTQF